MTTVSAAIARLVHDRAGERCEYCRTHQSLQVASFHVEHIIPSSAGGDPDSKNLALACPTCNLHKVSRTSATDPETQEVVPLFHPRIHVWDDHFRWSGYEIVARTAIGRATIAALHLNHPRRVNVRIAEQAFGLFPPPAA
jgi:hypothetical protein